MSSSAKKLANDVTRRKIETLVQVLAVLEQEAQKKNFWQRLKVSLQFLFTKRVDVFFKEANK